MLRRAHSSEPPSQAPAPEEGWSEGPWAEGGGKLAEPVENRGEEHHPHPHTRGSPRGDDDIHMSLAEVNKAVLAQLMRRKWREEWRRFLR